ncbi:MAG TPA: hypothetical protein VF790_01290 [Dissulfurispiraceae bacterium]
MNRMKIATVWLDGCSGCHMSMFDMDEKLIDIVNRADIVYSPLVDVKEFPEGVDITVIEGGVGNEEDLEMLETIRKRTRILVSYGDCAVTGNVPSLRNRFSVEDLIRSAYIENISDPGAGKNAVPGDAVPRLLPTERPLHAYVPVDVFIPGCPPRADTTYFLLNELLEGRIPDLEEKTRFGL